LWQDSNRQFGYAGIIPRVSYYTELAAERFRGAHTESQCNRALGAVYYRRQSLQGYGSACSSGKPGQGEVPVHELSCSSHAPAHAVKEVDCVLFWLSHNKVQFSRMVLNPLARPVDVPPEMPPVIGHAHTVPVFRKPEGEPAPKMNDCTFDYCTSLQNATHHLQPK
jgi:hypothetical protein